MESAFLEIVTRHLVTRPTMLAANVASLEAQTDGDWHQYRIVDDVGRGVPWANQQLHEHAHWLTGAYIWVLDDDDLCTCPTLVEECQAIAAAADPDVVMVRMDYAGQLLPAWEQPPREGYISSQNFIVRRELFQRHSAAWGGRNRYEGDFDFISAVWATGPRVYWHDCLAARDQRGRSWGKPE